jgi:hypothetical protein
MKRLIIALSLVLLNAIQLKAQQTATIVSYDNTKKSTKFHIASNELAIRTVSNGETNTWTLAPEAKPDILNVECNAKGGKVSFVTDVTKANFDVRLGEQIDFYIVYKQKDTCFTRIVGVPKNVNFTKEYIQAHKDKLEVEVPEVHELVNILVALSKVGRVDSNMVDITTSYRQEVIQYFEPYAKHPVMDTINAYITKSDEESYWYYYALKMNACGFMFTPQNKIVNKGIIRNMGFNGSPNPIPHLTALLEDFAKKSNFRKFYKSHVPYYNSLVTMYKKYNPIDKMQAWCESKFGFGYNNYAVYFSPLVYGAHSTNKFKDNGFNQTVMFICPSSEDIDRNEFQNEMWNSKIVFTEIDHNFVNPVTDKHRSIVDSVMSNRKVWVNDGNGFGTSAYSTPYAVFNEYMTYGIFSLYCIDKFPNEEVTQFMKGYENVMAEGRQFILFDQFNQELTKLYKSNPSISITDLYTHMLNWCTSKNKG